MSADAGSSSSVGATSTAKPSRVQGQETGSKDTMNYKIIMPTIPTGTVTRNTLFLHGNPEGRPYNVGHFGQALEGLVKKEDVSNFGVYQYNHVWVISFRSAIAKERLLAMKELEVKGQRCMVIDPNRTEIEIKIHWIPGNVSDEALQKALEKYGNVKEIRREKWKGSFFEGIDTTTRQVTIRLHEGVSATNLPHQTFVEGCRVLFSVPGRPPMCLRCKQIGHIRKQCHTPWCKTCRSYGHLDEECVGTYASRVRKNNEQESEFHIADPNEENKQRGTEADKDDVVGRDLRERNAQLQEQEGQVDESGTDEEMKEAEVAQKRKGSTKEVVAELSENKAQQWSTTKGKRLKSSSNLGLRLLPTQTDLSQLEDANFLTT
ncbi:uncharacterized protein LOC135378227 [Ornithodoros turicata]|uniref:uncharacterized protein LOC135378227 n=1 Tax=Ornithodoros turicata TaxID=34597 RepID=UPI003138A17A